MPTGAVSEELITMLRAVDPADVHEVGIALDTNVVSEILTMKDVLRAMEEPLGDPIANQQRLAYRRFRAAHSIMLAWHLSQRRIPASSLGNEAFDIISERLATPQDPESHFITTAIIQLVVPFVFGGWQPGALIDVDHKLVGTAADNELIRIASNGQLVIITWEGFTETGIVPDRTKLRDKCIARGLPVYTPAAYLVSLGVPIESEAGWFMLALEREADRALARGTLSASNARDLIGMYRFVLFGQA